MIERVISGGQTGIDVAALRVAKSMNIPTGGMMPKGWWTLAGQHPEYASLYGMVECARPGYPPRTEINVATSDVTIRIAKTFLSAGEVCTLKAIQRHRKPWCDIPMARGAAGLLAADRDCLKQAVALVRARAVELGHLVVLNVAGNSESTAHGIEAAAEPLLWALFAACLA